MSVSYYRAGDGAYLGAYAGGAMPPEGAIEVGAPPPDGSYVWSEGVWRQTLGAAKEIVVAEIKKELDDQLAVVPCSIYEEVPLVQLDETSQNRITALHAYAIWIDKTESTWPGGRGWRMADNSWHPFATAADAIEFCMWAFAAAGALRLNAWRHIDEVRGLTTVAAVNAYDFSTGW